MPNDTETLLHVAHGEAEAELLQTFLEGHGIPCRIQRESLLAAHIFSDDGMGDVRLHVPTRQVTEARQILADIEAGLLMLEEPQGEETPRDRWRDLG